MIISKDSRSNLGSGTIKFIDGFGFAGLGSAGFGDDDLLIVGDGADDNIEGGDGHDEIEGGAGNDIIKEGSGNGILEGEDGDDDLDGQEGTDKLFGGEGNDILRAGGSKPVIIETVNGKKTLIQGDFDQLIGGSGSDTFGFYGYGNFTVEDFKVSEDRLFFDSEILGIHSLDQLIPHITKITADIDTSRAEPTPFVTVEFLHGAASIKLMGISSIDEITADMVVFHL